MDESTGSAPYQESGALTGSTLGGFPLLSLLGVGGMAEVYRSVELPLQREVAIKVLPAHVAQDRGYVTRFRLEAQRVAALSHPHVVPVFRFGEERGLFYLVMPLLGESLRDRMRREGVLEPAEAVRLAIQVAEALDAAHRQGLVHRDVKPENILLGEEGQALLTDFGIAREVEVLRDATTIRTLAATGLPVGTPEYMAPEQLRGTVADQRVDVYGLGTVLYELLTGHLPHTGATTYELIASVLTDLPIPPTVYTPTLWLPLSEAMLRALAPNPEQRFPDMPSFIAALRQAMLDRDTGPSSTALQLAVPAPTAIAQPDSFTTRRLAALAAAEGELALGQENSVVDSWRYPPALTADQRQQRRRTILIGTVGALLVLVLGTTSGVLLTLHLIGPLGATGQASPTATTAAQVVPAASPSVIGSGVLVTVTVGTVTVGRAPTATLAPNASPIPTTTAVPTATATPLLTPTMIVSTNPLNFQPYPSTDPKFCIATQTLTNISAVDAQWSWTSTPAVSGWQYNLFDPDPNDGGWQGWPPHFPITTLAYGSTTIYFKTGYDNAKCTSKTATTPVVATISVTGGTGTTFTVTY